MSAQWIHTRASASHVSKSHSVSGFFHLLSFRYYKAWAPGLDERKRVVTSIITYQHKNYNNTVSQGKSAEKSNISVRQRHNIARTNAPQTGVTSSTFSDFSDNAAVVFLSRIRAFQKLIVKSLQENKKIAPLICLTRGN